MSDYRQEVAPSPASPVCRGGEEPVLVGQEIRGASGQGAEGEGEDGVEEEEDKSDQVDTAVHFPPVTSGSSSYQCRVQSLLTTS